MEKILLFLSLFSCLQAKAQVDTNSYSGSVTAFKTVHLQVVDTIPASYMGGEFTLKYVDNGGDTAYEYNHVEYVRRRISKEIDYWSKAGDLAWSKYKKSKTDKDYIDYITTVRRIEYWGGAYKALSFVLYSPYRESERFDYPLKTKGIN